MNEESDLELENELDILNELHADKEEVRMLAEKKIQNREMIFSLLKENKSNIMNNL